MSQSLCLHCNQALAIHQKKFCCSGCQTAYKIIKKGGFASYYKLRELKNGAIFNQPEIVCDFALEEFIESSENQSSTTLMISGLHCAACIWLIENLLQKQPETITARINLSQKTLFLSWQGDAAKGKKLIKLINQIGYKTLPFDSKNIANLDKHDGENLTKALAVAGFGAGNIMLFSFSLWFANSWQMGVATRQFLHFFSSLIALPVLVYSGRIFFVSAIRSLKMGYPNMDVPIAIAIFLASAVSLFQSFAGGEHVYFDSAVMLVFFLLIGRYLDFKMRKKAFNIATEFTLLLASFGRIEQDNKIKVINAKKLQPGMILLVAAGEKLAGDGVVIEGESAIDNSLINGESLPKSVAIGAQVFAGTINLAAPLRIRITKSNEENLISQIAKLVEKFESKKGHYVRLADYWSKIYTPAVHLLALLTFLGWLVLLDNSWQEALMKATAVLVITCPCALALAIPIVQTIAISSLIKHGAIVKNGEIFEKIHNVRQIIFDKTGTLTLGKPRLSEIFLINQQGLQPTTFAQKVYFLRLIASLTKHSKHPLSQAITHYFVNSLDHESAIIPNEANSIDKMPIKEISGFGIEGSIDGVDLRLGRKNFCGIKFGDDFLQNSLNFVKLDDIHRLRCYGKYGETELVFTFEDKLKSDAKQVLAELRKMGKKLILLSGDENEAVKKIANELEFKEFYSEQSPAQKAKFIEELKQKMPKGERLMMIGDGLNDAPSLALADISLSFSEAVDLTQNVADIVICGDKLRPLLSAIKIANQTLRLMKQNLLIALIYNLLAVPFAVAGLIVPLLAALAMSSSSILVLLNALVHSKKWKILV